MNKIYVVIGETGEYADHQAWIVAAYPDFSEAAKHMAAAQEAFCAALGDPSWSPDGPSDIPFSRYLDMSRRDSGFKNPHDPGAPLDYTGVRYGVVEAAYAEKFSG